MRVAFVSAEAVPFIKVGGLADVAGSLPPVLAGLGLDLTVYLPGRGPEEARPDTELSLSLEGQKTGVRLRRVDRDGVRFRFVDLPEFRGRPPYEGRGDPERYVRFCLAVDAALRASPPQVVHLHDWPAALLAVLLHQRRSRVRSILTLHNLAHQGRMDPGRFFALTGLPRSLFSIDALEFHGQVNLLKGGIVFADAVTTVSPTYAREIQSAAFGEGLDGVLRHHAGKLCGILNGIDLKAWDPSSDPSLPATYEAVSAPGKVLCRQALARRLGLTPPVLGMVGRLVWQKGVDLVLDALPRIVEMGYSLVVLGSGDGALERECELAAAAHPGRMRFERAFDEALARQIYAGAEAFLMPSRWEPCGLAQQIAMRYGTPPVVRATGGLVDTVDDGHTGLVFESAHAEGLLSALYRLRHGYVDRDALGAAGLARDAGWERAAAAYRALYERKDPFVAAA